MSSSSSTQSQPFRQHQGPLSEDSAGSAGRPLSDPRTSTFPFSFIRTSQSNPSSTSIVPSTAEGKAIPVDDSTVENRTSALRELNNHYPSRHRYEKSTGAQSSTYSEPVIVRSYYSPVSGRPASSTRGGVIVHGGAAAVSQSGGSSTRERRTLPLVTTVATARDGMMSRMARARQKNKLGGEPLKQAQLPPIEAFTFKSFISNIEAHDGTNDINADLDRIAEICAKSRYSLSNQYEVHYTPHGSGSTFLGGSSQNHDAQGPTLQAVTSDDERSLKRQRRRRNGARRSSRAMGTLETIMSSSRSSDEERSKRKSAAELAGQVRGRAARKLTDNISVGSQDATDDQHSTGDPEAPRTPPRRKAASLALIDGTATGPTQGKPSITPHSSVTALVSEPALPQASTSQLELRTTPEQQANRQAAVYTSPKKASVTDNVAISMAKGSISPSDRKNHGPGLFSSLSGWIPWRPSSTSARSPGRADGSLRELLRTTDTKGKDVDTAS
jgi:hypothetical protein